MILDEASTADETVLAANDGGDGGDVGAYVDVGDVGADVGDVGADVDVGDVGADVDVGDVGADVGDVGADVGDVGADVGDVGADVNVGDVGADANINEDGTADPNNGEVDENTKKTSRKRARKEERWKRIIKGENSKRGKFESTKERRGLGLSGTV